MTSVHGVVIVHILVLSSPNPNTLPRRSDYSGVLPATRLIRPCNENREERRKPMRPPHSPAILSDLHGAVACLVGALAI